MALTYPQAPQRWLVATPNIGAGQRGSPTVKQNAIIREYCCLFLDNAARDRRSSAISLPPDRSDCRPNLQNAKNSQQICFALAAIPSDVWSTKSVTESAMLTLIQNHPLFSAIGIGAFLCGVAVFHTVMMRTYRKRRAEEAEAAQAQFENTAG